MNFKKSVHAAVPEQLSKMVTSALISRLSVVSAGIGSFISVTHHSFGSACGATMSGIAKLLHNWHENIIEASLGFRNSLIVHPSLAFLTTRSRSSPLPTPPFSGEDTGYWSSDVHGSKRIFTSMRYDQKRPKNTDVRAMSLNHEGTSLKERLLTEDAVSMRYLQMCQYSSANSIRSQSSDGILPPDPSLMRARNCEH